MLRSVSAVIKRRMSQFRLQHLSLNDEILHFVAFPVSPLTTRTHLLLHTELGFRCGSCAQVHGKTAGKLIQVCFNKR